MQSYQVLMSTAQGGLMTAFGLAAWRKMTPS
jgi:hypothetical protein